MAINEFTVSQGARRAIEEMGYSIDASMDDAIARWHRWYTCSDDFYKVRYYDKDGRRHSRERLSVHPARKVCREMASLMLTEDTKVSVEAPKANAWLQRYLDERNFWPTGQTLVEKAFGLGTAAWALWYDLGDAPDVKLRRYDARMVKPLTFDEEGVAECAFVTRVSIKGEDAEQVQLHVLEEGTYRIKTMMFMRGRRLNPEAFGVVPDFDTRSPRKTFGVVKPALENVVSDLSPYGMSIFADAVGAIQAVDLAFDSLFQEVDLTAVKVFMDEALIDVRTRDGKVVPVADSDQRTFRMVAGDGAGKLIDVFSPAIRTEPLRQALDVALAELGEICGFGQQYFKLDRAGGLKTATEVVSDNSVLMRNVRKHENMVRGAIQDVVGGLLDGARIHLGADVEEDFGPVSVAFDDSVIADTATEKATMLSEIGAGVVPRWKYLATFYGMGEEEARAALAEEAPPAMGLGI